MVFLTGKCKDTTSFINRAFKDQGGRVLYYIDEFGGVASDKHTATQQLDMYSLLQCLGLKLKETAHKASPPAQAMIWLSLCFNTEDMLVTIPWENLQESFG